MPEEVVEVEAEVTPENNGGGPPEGVCLSCEG